METTTYGHLSRQLKESLERLALCVPPYAGHAPTEALSMGWLIPEINRLERIVSALESIGVSLDEDDIHGLELLRDDDNSYEVQTLVEAVNAATYQMCEQERESEYRDAIESLAAAGFVLDGETWTRNNETVTIELSDVWESRYRWTLTTLRHVTDPLPSTGGSGVSGEFHRLIKLIAANDSGSACGVSPSGEPCKTTEAL